MKGVHPLLFRSLTLAPLSLASDELRALHKARGKMNIVSTPLSFDVHFLYDLTISLCIPDVYILMHNEEGYHRSIIEKLLEADVEVNVPNGDSNYPLHLAVKQDHPGIVDDSLEVGADPFVKKFHKRTPRDIHEYFYYLDPHHEIIVIQVFYHYRWRDEELYFRYIISH
jgi:ankyrin repeat protein